MIADSIRYLHKSITALQNEKTVFSNARRIVPIVTVVSGLLDAGVSPEEPLLQSGLDFLAQYHAEQKKQKATLPKADFILHQQITACLKKAKKPATSPPAVCRLPSADCNTDLVVSHGTGTSVRIRNSHQPSLQKSVPAEKISADSFACDLLIAAVHDLPSFSPPLSRPKSPLPLRHHTEFLVCFVPPGHLKDREEAGAAPDHSSLVPVCLASFQLSASYKRESDKRLLADTLLALRTTRRLE